MRYLIIYDIADDRRLRCVARCLRAYGIRVQKSAFECELTETEALRLFRELKRIAAAGDSIIGYRISAKYGLKLADAEAAGFRGTDRKRQKSMFFAVRD